MGKSFPSNQDTDKKKNQNAFSTMGFAAGLAGGAESGATGAIAGQSTPDAYQKIFKPGTGRYWMPFGSKIQGQTATQRPVPPPKQKKPVTPHAAEVVAARQSVRSAAAGRSGVSSTMIYNPATGTTFGGTTPSVMAGNRTMLGG